MDLASEIFQRVSDPEQGIQFEILTCGRERLKRFAWSTTLI